jgi:3',5'-cyclic AMP phosphodiesterase CpdA
LLGRGFRFRCTDRVLAALRIDLKERGFDWMVFSGDATAMGFKEEMARAAQMLGAYEPNAPPGLAVPGNHDYCTMTTMVAGHFEHYFARWQHGLRIGKEVYPFAQRVGPVWLIGVNSAVANRWPWDARGAVGAAQLQRLEELLKRLDGGPRILVTHYPIRVASGKREVKIRALRDLKDLLEVARRGGIGLWLHGHRHNNYHHASSEDVPFPVICAGSATQSGLWSYSDYTVTEHTLRATQRMYQPGLGRFEDAGSFELELTPWTGRVSSIG